ncbi:GNAT family N-acetyltransferase [Salipiger sp. P9]|uniref:GNAT family N-acetyltransferase n=1 Tax=Salipiger pentaromativorans TaxID=2943193 RepID=UPI002157BA93|nr:GNAT family N-acetyltransferase [Salipiger pentaromativorans]MCR8549913.1 GNAT family N-acetyltransferase [Salipiger pentaromativorans]
MNTDLSCLPVVTERLVLRRFRPDDLVGFAAYHSREEVYRYLYQAVPEGAEMAEKFAGFLDTPFAAEGDRLRLAVTRAADEALLGQVSLRIASRSARQGEIGYIFHPDVAGRGYATEAVRALLDLAFGRVGFHRIFARLDPLNAGSVGVVERLGMRREAHLVQNDRFNGVWGDELIYALLHAEWAPRKAQGG